MSARASQALLELAAARLTPGPAAWLAEAAARPSVAGFSAAARVVGRAQLVPSPAERARARSLGADGVERWTLDELARAAILAAAAERSRDEAASLAWDAWRRGDAGERRAVIRALPLLPRDARLTALAHEAWRSPCLL